MKLFGEMLLKYRNFFLIEIFDFNASHLAVAIACSLSNKILDFIWAIHLGIAADACLCIENVTLLCMADSIAKASGSSWLFIIDAIFLELSLTIYFPSPLMAAYSLIEVIISLVFVSASACDICVERALVILSLNCAAVSKLFCNVRSPALTMAS